MSQGKIPTTVITGFLGSGKTTLIREILKQANGRRLALIINEFGDVGVDGEIVKACGEACPEENLIELANGCICCTVADDFIPTMETLLGRDEPPEHIIIETSGLALPQPLLRAFTWPEIRARVTVDGVVTVVDGAALAEGRFAQDEDRLQRQREQDESLDHDDPIEELFGDQLNCADVVLLNKSDLLDRATISRMKEQMKERLRPGTPLIATANGSVDVASLLGLSSAAEDDVALRPSQHELEGGGDHDHDEFESFTVNIEGASDRESLLSRIRSVITKHDILRLKGFLAVRDSPSRLLVQAVGPRLDSYFDRSWNDGEDRSSVVVVIGLKGMNREAISAAIAG